MYDHITLPLQLKVPPPPPSTLTFYMWPLPSEQVRNTNCTNLPIPYPGNFDPQHLRLIFKLLRNYVRTTFCHLGSGSNDSNPSACRSGSICSKSLKSNIINQWYHSIKTLIIAALIPASRNTLRVDRNKLKRINFFNNHYIFAALGQFLIWLNINLDADLCSLKLRYTTFDPERLTLCQIDHSRGADPGQGQQGTEEEHGLAMERQPDVHTVDPRQQTCNNIQGGGGVISLVLLQ